MTRQFIALAALGAATAACAPVEDDGGMADAAPVLSSERQCFFTRQINGYGEAPEGPDGEERIYVRTGVNDRWLLEPIGVCPEIDFALRIGLDTRTMTSLCTDEITTLLVPSTIPGEVDRCRVRVLGKVIES